MQLFVDARCLQDPNFAPRGIGRHSAGVIRHARDFLPEPISIIALVDEQMPPIWSAYQPLFDAARGFASPPTELDGAALLLQPSPMTHPASRIAPWLMRKNILTCEIFYDLIPLDEPLRYLPSERLRIAYFESLCWLKQYQLHAPISQFAASCLTDTLQIDPRNVVVTGAGIRPAFTDFDARCIANQPSPARFPRGNYFIQLGGSDARKNAEAVMKAHGVLTKEGQQIGLVIAGHYIEGYREVLLALHREYGGVDRDVQFTPDVSDHDLSILYHNALACVCPSKSEGFSLPVVEALACGCPVIAANCPAQMELVEQPEALFDPDDFMILAAKMKQFLAEPAFRDRLFQQQEAMGKRYHEKDVAARVWLSVRERWQRDFSPHISAAAIQRRPRIAVLMPYPDRPVATASRLSGSDYLARTLRWVAEAAEIEVFASNRVPQRDPWIAAFHPLSKLPLVSPQYDHVLALLGNGPEYRRIMLLQDQFPSPCITFDDRLTEFHRKVLGDESTAEYAKQHLRRTVDGDEIDRWLTDPQKSPLTFFESIARAVHPLIVHSQPLQRRLARRASNSVIHLPPVGLQRFSVDDLTPSARQAAKDRLRFQPGRIHLLVPGGDIHEWGHWEVPYAIEQLRRWGIEAEAHWVTSISPALRFEMEKVGNRIGNRARLHFHPIAENELIPADYFLAADFAVVYRTAGLMGVPMDVLDCLDAHLPTVMNRALSQGLAVDSVVMEVAEPVGAFLMAEALRTAVTEGAHRERLSARWQQYSEERSPASYARRLLALLQTEPQRQWSAA